MASPAALLGSFALAATACDARSASPEGLTRASTVDIASRAAPESSQQRLREELGFDADIEIPIDPPAAAGDLKAEIARFTTVDACVTERAQVDPILGDALEAIGYDTFLRDACRIIDATKANDPDRCKTINASSLEARCRATVAEVGGSPERCPWEAATRRARGRDARCLAVATRDPRLCAGVRDPLDSATCDAILGPDRHACVRLLNAGERARCARDAERWRSIVDGSAVRAIGSNSASPADTHPFVVTGTLHVEGAAEPDGTASKEPVRAKVDVDLAPDFARGVTIVEQRDGARITFGSLAERTLDFVAPSPHTRASLALELFLPTVAPPSRLSARGDSGAVAGARIERAELLVPGHSPVSTPGARSTLVAGVELASLARGRPLKLVVSGDLGIAGANWHVHAEATTFVRDVVRSVDLYDMRTEDSPWLGEDGGMRYLLNKDVR